MKQMDAHISYDELPKRGKVTSDGERIRNCACGRRCYATYLESGLYKIECERCGLLVIFKARSLDWAIKIWNDIMPIAIGA